MAKNLSDHLITEALAKLDDADELLTFEEDMKRVQSEAGKSLMALAWAAHNALKKDSNG